MLYSPFQKRSRLLRNAVRIGCALWRSDASVGSMILPRPHRRRRCATMMGTKIRDFTPLPNLSLEEPVPDHSSLTRIRERYGLESFRGFFERIVEMCVEAGLVRGEELFFDSTKVKANADIDSLASRFLVETHLSGLFEESSTPEASVTEPSAGTDLDTLPTSEDETLSPRMPERATGSPGRASRIATSPLDRARES